MAELARRLAAPVFALAMLTSAALIFALQPLFARMVTPLLGGSPAVWNASMAFFQAALLIGYVYAHLLQRIRDLRAQALVHALVLLAAWLVLPIRVQEAFGPPSSEHPALWLIGVLTVSVGAPFAAASATAPLLQAWFARTGRPDSRDPYYLYAASNLGSFAGLIAYPAVIEPLLGAGAQSQLWSLGYVLACVLIGLCALAAIGAGGKGEAAAPEDDEAVTWPRRAFWMGAAAVPSALILGVTLHISTDVASAPLLWVIPLALYLATFVIAFARGSERIAPQAAWLHAGALALLIASYFSLRIWSVTLVGNLFGFFMSALVCHLALTKDRPHAARLTEFYFWVSLGGVCGGAFAAFLAPVLFDNVYEYPLALAAAALFAPRGAAEERSRIADPLAAGAVAMTLVVMLLARANTAFAALIGSGLAGAALVAAAGWDGLSERRLAPLRVSFMIVAVLFAAFVLAIGFNTGIAFEGGNASGESAALAAPWNAISAGLAAVCLACIVASIALAGRREDLVQRLVLGAASAPILLFLLFAAQSAPALAAFLFEGDKQAIDARAVVVVALGFAAAAILMNRGRPWVMGLLVLVAFSVIFLHDNRGVRVARQERTFFGVLRTEVISEAGPDVPELRVLMHGTTLHGAQLQGAGADRTPLTYYNPQTALGEAVLAGVSMGETSNVALIGLGTGSTACLIRPEDKLTIYEIDPMVVRLSGPQGSDFTYVRQCQPNAPVMLGDARLRIAEAPDGAYDVILVDAFSSDAIPAHLLTREAVALYLRKTSARGIVVLHLSNRHLALVSEAARVSRDLGVPNLWRVSDPVTEGPAGRLTGSVASAMIVARDEGILAQLPRASLDWRAFAAPPGASWTDDYINLARALWDSANGVEECRMFPYTCADESGD